MRALRKKIEKIPASPEYIVSVPWVGYRFRRPGDLRGAESQMTNDLIARDRAVHEEKPGTVPDSSKRKLSCLYPRDCTESSFSAVQDEGDEQRRLVA